MKSYVRKNLNIKRLLALGDLDIRSIAAEDGRITANEYFYRVEQFIENNVQLRNVLENVSTKTNDSNTLKNLADIKNLLAQIGYRQLDMDIDSLCSAVSKGDHVETARISKEILSKYMALCNRLHSTYTFKKFANMQNNEKKESKFDDVLLQEALMYFDYEESNRKLRILAVDDVIVALNTITSILSPYYEVFALKNSSHIEKFLMHTTPDLFLLDIEMKGINGFDLIPIIRRHKEHADTPIIFLTGNASLQNLKDAVKLGACDFIIKPIDTQVLLEKIEKNIVKK